jgi:hypothetical protein
MLAFCGAAILILLAIEPAFFMPAEDAVILWAYSKNLALHGAITYFAGGPHTEGATDFAWMIAVAGAIKCHIDPEIFSAAINVITLSLLAVLLVRTAQLRLTPMRILMVIGAVGSMPQIFAAASGFAILPDAVLLTALVYWTTREALGGTACAALLLCLFRPDGLVFVLPLFVVLLATSSNRARVASMFLGLFALPGAAYFVWRYNYFHELLPLPMLVKSDALRFHHTVVLASVRTSLVFLAFAITVTASVWYATKAKFVGKYLIAPLIIIPTAFYWCVRLDQNVGFRFFYYLPLAAGIILALNWRSLGHRRGGGVRIACLAWLLLLAMPLRRELRTFLDLQSPTLRAIARELGGIKVHGEMLSSEAGILPYYSGWRSVDPWGLDTAEYAHRFFQPKDVAITAPSLIHLHPDQGEGCIFRSDWTTPYLERSWPGLTRNIISGATSTDYELWQASYGSDRYRMRKHWQNGEGDVSCWFVRKGTPEEYAIGEILERHQAVRKY